MISLFLALFLAQAQAAIFGLDDRVAISPSAPSYELARSTAVAVLSSLQSKSSPGKLRLEAGSLDGLVCSSERFSHDPSLDWACTGFLVAPDLIATAGHCMVNTGESRHETESYCEAFSWLFDYQLGADGKALLDGIPEEKLYHCKQVVYAIREETAPFRDFALVQLTRRVEDRPPLAISNTPVQEGDPVRMIGYPFGTPAKLSRNAKILTSDPKRQSFITNLDAFEGNSGSPVFDSAGKVVGILTGGTPALSLMNRGRETCQRYNRCNESGSLCATSDEDVSIFPGFQRTGSEVQRIAPLADLIRSLESLERK